MQVICCVPTACSSFLNVCKMHAGTFANEHLPCTLRTHATFMMNILMKYDNKYHIFVLPLHHSYINYDLLLRVKNLQWKLFCCIGKLMKHTNIYIPRSKTHSDVCGDSFVFTIKMNFEDFLKIRFEKLTGSHWHTRTHTCILYIHVAHVHD